MLDLASRTYCEMIQWDLSSVTCHCPAVSMEGQEAATEESFRVTGLNPLQERQGLDGRTWQTPKAISKAVEKTGFAFSRIWKVWTGVWILHSNMYDDSLIDWPEWVEWETVFFYRRHVFLGTRHMPCEGDNPELSSEGAAQEGHSKMWTIPDTGMRGGDVCPIT